MHLPLFANLNLFSRSQQLDAGHHPVPSANQSATCPKDAKSSGNPVTEESTIGLDDIANLLKLDMKNEGQMKPEEIDQVLNYLGDVFRNQYLAQQQLRTSSAGT